MKKKYRMIHTASSQPATPSWPNPGSTSTGPKRTHRVMGDPQCGGSHADMSPPILFFFLAACFAPVRSLLPFRSYSSLSLFPFRSERGVVARTRRGPPTGGSGDQLLG